QGFSPTVTPKRPKSRRPAVANWDNAIMACVSLSLIDCTQASNFRRFSCKIKHFHRGCGLRHDVERPRRRKPGPFFFKLTVSSVGLPAQEGGDVQLIFLHRVVHRRLPSVLVEPLMRSTPGIF